MNGEEGIVVLVVDDDAVLAAAIARRLRHLGCDTRTASSSDEALSLAKQLKPRLAVVDQVLGSGPNGLDVVRALRRVSPTTLSVIFSAFVSDDLEFAAWRAGAFKCLGKDARVDELHRIACYPPLPAEPKTLQEMADELIDDALAQEDTVARAAKRLGISPRGLERKVKKRTGQSPRRRRPRD